MINKSSRKITSFFIAICVLFCTNYVYVEGTAAESEKTAIRYEEEREFLHRVNEIIPPSQDAGAGVTRSEFACYLAKMLNVAGKNTEGNEIIFRDLLPDDTAYESIFALRNMGVISGDPGGYFRGDENIVFEEAIKMLVNVLGYGTMLRGEIDYPAGYFILAEKAEITKNVDASFGMKLNLDIVCKLLYNTINARFVETSYSNRSVAYSTQGNGTILTDYYKIYRADGILEANNYTSLNGMHSADDKSVVVDGITYKTTRETLNDYLGLSVKIYYREDTGQREEVFVFKSDKNRIKIIDADDIEGYSNGRLSYYRENSNTLSFETILPYADIVYNNKRIEAFSDILFSPQMGEIKLIDNNNDNKYEVIIIKEYKNITVKTVSATDKFIIDKNLGSAIDLDESRNPRLEKYILKNVNGEKMMLSAIKSGDVISVVESRDGSIVDMTVSTVQKMVKITGIDRKKDKLRLLADDEEFYLDPHYKNYIENTNVRITPGKSCTLHIDMCGKVAMMDFDEASLNYGFMISAAKGKGLDDTIRIKYLNSAGTISVAELSKKVKINKNDCSNGEETIRLLKSISPDGRYVFGYSLNAEGQIRQIILPSAYGDRVAEGEEFIQPITRGPVNVRYKSATRVIVPNIVVPDSAIVFDVPSDKGTATDNSYSVVIPALIKNDTVKDWHAYRIKKDSFYADILVAYDYNASTVIEAGAYEMLVDEVSRVLADDGSVKYKISGMYLRERKEYVVYEDEVVLNALPFYEGRQESYAVDTGDIIRIALNSNNEVTHIQMFYDYSENDMCMIDGGYAAGDRWCFQQVYDKDNEYLAFIDPSADVSNPDITPEIKEVQRFNKFVCAYVYDSDKKEAKGASIEDVKTIKDHKTEGSYVFIHNHYGEAQTIVVYR